MRELRILLCYLPTYTLLLAYTRKSSHLRLPSKTVVLGLAMRYIPPPSLLIDVQHSMSDLGGVQVPQLYLSPPASANSPPYLLKGFDSVPLASGASTTVTFQVSRYDLSVWNVVTQRWTIARGTWGATVGASSRDRRLTGTFAV